MSHLPTSCCSDTIVVVSGHNAASEVVASFMQQALHHFPVSTRESQQRETYVPHNESVAKTLARAKQFANKEGAQALLKPSEHAQFDIAGFTEQFSKKNPIPEQDFLSVKASSPSV